MSYQPPFSISNSAAKLVAEISEMLDLWSAESGGNLSPQLRRNNRIRTIHASLAIENNSLTEKQVSAVIEGKPVLGSLREIKEVQNAILAYEEMPNWQPANLDDLLKAHEILMCSLVDEAGKFRSTAVGIYKDKELIHMAPPADRVPYLMKDLLTWLDKTETHPLITSCVFHYEFEFIHPFSDGNGRMGRLWQSLILSKWQPLLIHLPVETIIHQQQEQYYQALSACDKAGDSTLFIEFMLSAIKQAMEELE